MLGDWERCDYWLGRAEDAAEDRVQSRLARVELGLYFGHPEYALSARSFEDTLDDAGLTSGELPEALQAQYGAVLSLAGDHPLAIDVLLPLNDFSRPQATLPSEIQVDVMQALAWSWKESGRSEQATELLAALRDIFLRYDDEGRLELGRSLLMAARNEALLGETSRALDLLERAERAGWRDLFHVVRDPRWGEVGEDPRFRAVMARVRASIDLQREQIDASSADIEFIEQLEAAMRATAPREPG